MMKDNSINKFFISIFILLGIGFSFEGFLNYVKYGSKFLEKNLVFFNFPFWIVMYGIVFLLLFILWGFIKVINNE